MAKTLKSIAFLAAGDALLAVRLHTHRPAVPTPAGHRAGVRSVVRCYLQGAGSQRATAPCFVVPLGNTGGLSILDVSQYGQSRNATRNGLET